MWVVYGNNLGMTEGDYGIELPVTIHGITLQAADSLKFIFKTATDGDVLLEKDYSNIQDNTAYLEFTEAESELFEANMTYVFSLDLYQEGEFLCNVIPRGVFKVENKV